MIFTGAHWYYGVFQVFLFAFGFFAALWAVKHRRCGLCLLLLIALWLLGYKIWEYIPFRRWPLDFSAVTYFLFGFAVLLPIRPLKVAASFSGMLAGICFISTMVVLPEMHYETQPSEFTLMMAFLNHNLLFVGGIILSGRYPFKKTDCFWIIGWIIAVIIYIEVLTNVFGVVQDTAVFTKIIDGSIIFMLLNKTFVLHWWYYILYYLFCASVLILLFFIFFKINKWLRR